MAQRENQRVMLTKRLLKESLIRLLKEEGIYKVSVSALCEEAGINRTTFYKYYGSPLDLLTEMEDDLLYMIQQAIDSSNEERQQALEMVCVYLAEHLELTQMLINNNVDPEFPRRLFSMPAIQRELTREFGERYAQEELQYASCFLIFGSYYLIRKWINDGAKEPPAQIAQLLLSLITSTAR